MKRDLDAENFAGRLIDFGILLPRGQALYEFAATDLDEPHLRDFIENGNPTYAWQYDDRDAWEPRIAQTDYPRSSNLHSR